jgi:hypothetical protein
MAERDLNQPSRSALCLFQDAQGRWWNYSRMSVASPSDPQQQSTAGSDMMLTSPSPVPIATSTPRTASSPPQPILVPYTRSERQAEDDLFQRIERLIRDFLSRLNRRYPYHRIMEWTLPDDPTLNYRFVVVITPPSSVLD